MEAVRALAGRLQTDLAMAVLDGLQLSDDDGVIRPEQSPYARHYLQLLQKKADENQVVNRGELIETIASGIAGPLEKDIAFGLEPEWVVVNLLALVYHGSIVLNVDGRDTIDAGSLERAATLSMEQLTDFRYYKRPRGLDLATWTAIFQVLGLP